MKTLLLCLFILSSSAVYANCSGIERHFKLVDPTDHKDWDVKTKAYLPTVKKGETYPVVFVLPTIVGETALERSTARIICSKGMGAYVLNIVKEIPLEEQLINLNIHDELYVRALAALKVIIAELRLESQVGDFGIIGASQGGMMTAYLAGSEPLLKTSVIIVGAGNVPGVLAYSDQKLVKKQREDRMAHFGIATQEEYQAILQTKVPHDPITVAHQIKPGSSYVFIGTKDTTVPTKYQRQLLGQIQDPLVFEMKSAHVASVIKANSIHLGKILRFFKYQFAN